MGHLDANSLDFFSRSAVHWLDRICATHCFFIERFAIWRVPMKKHTLRYDENERYTGHRSKGQVATWPRDDSGCLGISRVDLQSLSGASHQAYILHPMVRGRLQQLPRKNAINDSEDTCNSKLSLCVRKTHMQATRQYARLCSEDSLRYSVRTHIYIFSI
jgi:hypothetical protein